jgi:hypothetical protein
MRWVLRLIATGDDAGCRSTDLAEVCRPDGLHDIADLGLTLLEAKQLLGSVQRALVAGQSDNHGLLRPDCRSCGERCHVKDRRAHRIATLFGEVTVRLPRFLCAACHHTEMGVGWPLRCRSTPELDQLQAHLSALMTYRVATGVLQHLLPIDAGRSPETFRRHTLLIGQQLAPRFSNQPATPVSAITVSVDSTFIRSREKDARHLEVRVGNVETAGGSRQVFAAVAKSDSDISALLRQKLDVAGRAASTVVTAFTDGCPGLRTVLVNAGVPTPPILDWFHLAMRFQHAAQAASALSADNARRVQAKAMIVEEVERLRWRIWNGKAKNARRSIDRIRKVMHVYKRERSPNTTNSAASRRLWHALHNIDEYLRGQSSWLVNYARRHRAGLRVGTSITEGTANFLVNRRMNKSQQMRWSRRGADLLLQVRCAVFNGMFGSGFGQLFQPHANQNERSAKAA